MNAANAGASGHRPTYQQQQRRGKPNIDPIIDADRWGKTDDPFAMGTPASRTGTAPVLVKRFGQIFN